MNDATTRDGSPISGMSPRLMVHLGYATPRAGIPAAGSFRHWVSAALHGARHHGATAELSIRIVDACQSRALNSSYRGQDHPTNVLAFEARCSSGLKTPLIGDLVICAPVVTMEAARQGKRARDHWAHLTIHGTLHLLGYDHIKDTDARIMEALEIRILAGLGIKDPYLA